MREVIFFYFSKFTILILICIFLTCFLEPVYGQDSLAAPASDSLIYELEPILVTATRLPGPQFQKPFTVSTADITHLHTARQMISLHEALVSLPGILALNANNFAQDLRLAIRGFGARAAFGMRGIKVLVDGVPQTTPDGQTQLDNLDLSLLDHAEILRGPVSALHGNASGGVIQLTTTKPPVHPFIESRIIAGAFGYGGLQIKTGGKSGATRYMIGASLNGIEGYREHSAMKNYLFNGILTHKPDSLSNLAISLGLTVSPQADDPGALSREQLKDDPVQAYATNKLYNAGESVDQIRTAVSFERKFAPNREFKVTGYFTRRIFDNRLPFLDGGMVELTRNYGGAEIDYSFRSGWHGFDSRIATGISIAHQDDRRKRYDNLMGTKGTLVFDQDELYSNAALFVEQELSRPGEWSLTYGLRYDLVSIKARDHYYADGNSTGERLMNGPSGMVGVILPVGHFLNIFANLSTGFETPALVELSANPEGGGGLNSALSPQRAINYEAGLKGYLFGHFYFESAIFYIDVYNELLPYELAATPGRTYYRNAGRSKRKGLEISLTGSTGTGLIVSVNYTFSDFKFSDYVTTSGNYSGNSIPGLPRHMFNLGIMMIRSSGFFSRIEMISRSKIYTNDANSFHENPVVVTGIQLGYRFYTAGWRLEPFAGINNLFETGYSDNIRINAFGARYFEPAPGRHIFAGISLHAE